MKRLLAIILVILCFGVSACSKSEGSAKTDNVGKTVDTNITREADKKDEIQSGIKEKSQAGTEEKSSSGTVGDSLSGNEDGVKTDKDNDGGSDFTPDIPSSGGINYEYEIVSAYDDNGNEASWNHMTWFVSYYKSYTIVQAPIWEECSWENAIGTEEDRLPAGLKNGELTLTSYSAGEDYMGALGSSKTLRFDIKGDTATVYNVDDGITYNCVLYRSFKFSD